MCSHRIQHVWVDVTYALLTDFQLQFTCTQSKTPLTMATNEIINVIHDEVKENETDEECSMGYNVFI